MTSNLPTPPAYPWERQDTEPPKAWTAFQHYRDTPTARRSAGTTAQHMIDQGELKGTYRTVRTRMETWSVQHEWVERSKLWDAELDKRRREQFAQAHLDTSRRHATLAQAGLRFVSSPVEEFVKRLANRESRDADYLRNLSMGELAALGIQCAKIMPVLMAAESQARGNMPVSTPAGMADSPSAGEVKRPTIDRARAVYAAMEDAQALVLAAPEGNDG